MHLPATPPCFCLQQRWGKALSFRGLSPDARAECTRSCLVSPWPQSGGRGEGAGPSAGLRATAVLGGKLVERCVEGHRQGEPETEASTDGPSEGPAEGHAPRRGHSFLPWALESGASSGLETVLSCQERLFTHCQEWRSSDSAGKAVLHVCRWQEEGRGDERDSQSGPCPALSGGQGAMQTSRMGFWVLWPLPPDHSWCEPHVFFFLVEGEKERAVSCLWIGGGQSRCSVYSLRGFCRRTHVLQDGFTLSWSDPLELWAQCDHWSGVHQPHGQKILWE